MVIGAIEVEWVAEAVAMDAGKDKELPAYNYQALEPNAFMPNIWDLGEKVLFQLAVFATVNLIDDAALLAFIFC